MGEKENKPFQLSFNRFLKVDFQGSRVPSDGGLVLVRELDERLGLGKLIDEHLTDSRQGTNKKFPFADLVRQSVYSRLAGYEDLNDAVRVSADPTFRLLASQQNWDRGGARPSRRQSFETELLASDENLLGRIAVNRELVAQAVATGRAERDHSGDLRGALPPVKGKHLAALTDPKQVDPLLRVLDGYHGTLIVRCALRLAPLVFVRPGDLRRAEWSDIDLEAAEWRYTVTKTDMPHIVPLSRQAVEILRELHPLTG